MFVDFPFPEDFQPIGVFGFSGTYLPLGWSVSIPNIYQAHCVQQSNRVRRQIFWTNDQIKKIWRAVQILWKWHSVRNIFWNWTWCAATKIKTTSRNWRTASSNDIVSLFQFNICWRVCCVLSIVVLMPLNRVNNVVSHRFHIWKYQNYLEIQFLTEFPYYSSS